jgi:hypothetical protein
LRRCILSVVSYVLGFIVSENDIQVEFTYISIKHGTIGKTPFEIMKRNVLDMHLILYEFKRILVTELLLKRWL